MKQNKTKQNKTRVAVGDNDWQMLYESSHAHHTAMKRKQNAWLAKESLKRKKIFSNVIEKCGIERIAEWLESKLIT